MNAAAKRTYSFCGASPSERECEAFVLTVAKSRINWDRKRASTIENDCEVAVFWRAGSTLQSIREQI